jgi:lysozyme
VTDDEIKQTIKRHEGYRDAIYEDSVGVLTGGYGHAFQVGQRLPRDVWERFFDDDYQTAVDGYNSTGLDLDPVRRGIIINMIFNMGIYRFNRFRKLRAALNEKNYEWAAREMEDSLWFRQTGHRAIELVALMRTAPVIF